MLTKSSSSGSQFSSQVRAALIVCCQKHLGILRDEVAMKLAKVTQEPVGSSWQTIISKQDTLVTLVPSKQDTLVTSVFFLFLSAAEMLRDRL